MADEQLAESLERLHDIVGSVVSREGFELVDLQLKRAQKGHLLRIYIDRAGRTTYLPPKRDEGPPTESVGIADCVRVSKSLGPVLDVEDAIPSAYTLEVSSPGLNRPLKTPRHFELARGCTVRLKTRVPVEGESFFIGGLRDVTDEGIVLDLKGDSLDVPYRWISQANIEPDLS